MNLFAAEELRVSVGGRLVLDGVSVALGRGEVVGLLGPNGSGKSTLLKVMAGFIAPKAGRVRLDTRDFASMTGTERARSVGFLPQNARSDWPLKVRDIVALGRLPHRPLLKGATIRASDETAIETALRQVDCQHLADRPVTALSGGELTRTMIARVLAGEPDFLLLDEPATGLDPRYQLELMGLLRQLVGAPERRGALVVLHDLALAARFCDRVLVLSEGRAIAEGPVAEALTETTIASAFGVTVRLLPDTGIDVPLAWSVSGSPT